MYKCRKLSQQEILNFNSDSIPTQKFQAPTLMFLCCCRPQMTQTAPTRGLGRALSKIPLSSVRCGRWEPSTTWKRRERREKTVPARTTAGLYALPSSASAPVKRPLGGLFSSDVNIGRRPKVVLRWLQSQILTHWIFVASCFRGIIPFLTAHRLSPFFYLSFYFLFCAPLHKPPPL